MSAWFFVSFSLAYGFRLHRMLLAAMQGRFETNLFLIRITLAAAVLLEYALAFGLFLLGAKLLLISFSTSDHYMYLLAVWCLAGFRIHPSIVRSSINSSINLFTRALISRLFGKVVHVQDALDRAVFVHGFLIVCILHFVWDWIFQIWGDVKGTNLVHGRHAFV